MHFRESLFNCNSNMVLRNNGNCRKVLTIMNGQIFINNNFKTDILWLTLDMLYNFLCKLVNQRHHYSGTAHQSTSRGADWGMT